MDPEQSAAGAAPQTAQPQTAVPEAGATVAKSNLKTAMDSDFSQFKEHSTFNMAMALTWMVAVFSIIATLFFWWINKNESDALADKTSEKDSLTQQITSPGSMDIEQKAQDFKSSVAQLKKAYADKYSYTQFLSDFNKKITNDAKLSNIAITSDGVLNINGTTKSYRSVADLMVALKSWDTLNSVELLSVANNTTEGGKVETIFAISAKIDKEKQKTAAAVAAAAAAASTTTTEGGSSAAQ